ncbi:SpaH/EbpB family LPXTG-anchored major pilin [Hespellia stercorisuis]|uniref:LPXTG-motif cell wall anchor domain-containing protein/fimbrial isopeptide formation D2 domain-containing protein n=1 Tax=Hespellia stercorisuis DSM 15480 TaxID=1121950 RepID=A0A1M6I2X6_9FIRM|nr:SpaH/EbpB family LPXTG-anchored major pilin [Hespellia stercorisuis]SHJ28770.1 LPXTG-motif cell wall anchor domain-containing protein/fimbrial isopeptide formation D2 domain-containing protein [Hespellia stercorisuis DSM 15480]
MKRFKKMKTMLAVLLAMVLTLGMGTSVFAAANNSIQVTGNKEFAGKKVDAYQMFSATTSGTAIAYTLNPQYESFFKSNADYGCTDLTGTALSDAAYQYVQKLGSNDDAKVTAFAKEVSDYMRNNTTETFTVAGTATASETGAATITGLEDGYYLVLPDSGSTSATRKTAAQLISVTGGSTEAINLKSEYPTVDKEITGGTAPGATDANIGDTVTFTLTSKVPDMTDYDTYTFKFLDTLSKGLTFGSVTSVTVDGVAITPETDYTVSSAPNTTDNTKTDVTIELTGMKDKYADKAGKTIVVTYTATLNENAVSGTVGNENSAKIEYSNDPTGNGTGTSTPDVVKTYTFDFTLDKYTGTYGNDATRLAGATFELRKGADAGSAAAISLIQVKAGTATEAAVYRPAKAGETGTVTSVTTPESGKIQFTGLDAGTYYLFETAAPDGYNKLAAPITVEISADYNKTTGELETVSVKYNGTAAETGNIVPVQNNTGTTLPSTGGLGTLLLTIAGVCLVIFGLVRRNRKMKVNG